MTEQEFLRVIDIAVAQWLQHREGLPLVPKPFDQALEAQCHANAESFVALHGGEVVHGFLIQRPHGWPTVWVMAHTAVRIDGGLVDVTLDQSQLRGLAFFAVAGPVSGFVDWAKRYPRETRPIPAA